jgi:alkylation response protein AidB-like acyl-CoA dehydrogenase
MGEIAEDLLFPFPRMRQEEQETLRTLIQSFESWLGPKAERFREWDVRGEMPAEFLDEMKEFGLFGLVIPEEHGGYGFSSTAYSRTLQELARYDGSTAVTVGAHSSIGMRGLLLFGTEAQKARYLPRLATGEMIAAFCLSEPGSGSDAASIRTTARREGDKWILDGEKIWTTNGGFADLYTVFARTDTPEGRITAFIVTRDLEGVSIGPHEDKMGIRASSTTSVTLRGVELDDSHVLGGVGKGFKVAMAILNKGRTGLGGGTVGIMKRMVQLATAHASQRQQFGRPIAEFGLIQQKLGHMVVECYATESVVAMVAGLIDRGHEDYAVEAAISKVFGTECAWRTVDEALQVAGGMGFMREQPYERFLRDARVNRIFEGTNEILRLFIALTAMNDAGRALQELSQSLGNVLEDPIKGFGLLSDYARRRMTYATGFGRASLTRAHPALHKQAAIFENGAGKLSATVDRVLRKHGKAIVDKQFATKRLADIMIDLFVLACVLSRVTASIEEHGLDETAREQDVCAIFAGQVEHRVRRQFEKIDENDDELVKAVARDALARGRFGWDNL